HFDVVIIDEFHHAAAPTYTAPLNHLLPRELLGLTATPERGDDEPTLQWSPAGLPRSCGSGMRSTSTGWCRLPITGSPMAPTIETSAGVEGAGTILRSLANSSPATTCWRGGSSPTCCRRSPIRRPCAPSASACPWRMQGS